MLNSMGRELKCRDIPKMGSPWMLNSVSYENSDSTTVQSSVPVDSELSQTQYCQD